jgi:tannase/feruloyl esterase
MAFGKPDPNFDAVKSLNFDTDLQRLGEIRDIVNATDTDLSAFKARGGKIVMYFGWADTALNPLMGIDYFEGVSKRFGPATAEFFKLYMAPGMFHCRSGPGPSVFDAFTALVNWVEKGKAPAEIIASQAGGSPARTRPLCPYPEVARYKGSGSIDEASSFVCRRPDALSTSATRP